MPPVGAADSLLGQAVKAYCQQHLEDYKVPKIVAFVESLPKTAGGKIKRASKD